MVETELVPALLRELLERLVQERALDRGAARIEFLFVRGELREWYTHDGPIPAGLLPPLPR
jgi:hypothetical protein